MFGYRPRYYLFHPWKIVEELWDALVCFWQRGRRGWADCDAWNADTYIAEVISGLCARIAAHGRGTPWPFFEDEDHGDETYRAYLKELALAFQDYVCFMTTNACFEDRGNVKYTQLIERMRHLFDYYAAISD